MKLEFKFRFLNFSTEGQVLLIHFLLKSHREVFLRGFFTLQALMQ